MVSFCLFFKVLVKWCVIYLVTVSYSVYHQRHILHVSYVSCISLYITVLLLLINYCNGFKYDNHSFVPEKQKLRPLVWTKWWNKPKTMKPYSNLTQLKFESPHSDLKFLCEHRTSYWFPEPTNNMWTIPCQWNHFKKIVLSIDTCSLVTYYNFGKLFQFLIILEIFLNIFKQLFLKLPIFFNDPMYLHSRQFSV